MNRPNARGNSRVRTVGREETMLTFRPLRCAEALRALLAPLAFAASLALAFAAAPASAQGDEEVAFTPRKDAEEIRTKPKKPSSYTPIPVAREFSFLRYEGILRKLCDALASDGRRDRLVEVGREAFPVENECLACKALWRTVLASCSPRTERLSPQPRRRPKPGEEPEVTPTPAPVQYVGQRLPSAEAVEMASEVSIRMQKDEPGDAPNLMALRSVFGRVLQHPGLSPAERDYYSALEEYLYSAWQGR